MGYCTQNNGHCETCALVNYGRDCHNNSIKMKHLTVRVPEGLHKAFIKKLIDEDIPSAQGFFLEKIVEFLEEE